MGIVVPPANFVANWGSALLFNGTRNERFRARAEAFDKQQEAINWAFRSPTHFLTAIGKGGVGTLDGFSQSINDGRGEEAAGILSGTLAQAATAGSGGGFRMTPTGGLVTAEGMVLQGGATVARTGPGLAGAGILMMAGDGTGEKGPQATIREERRDGGTTSAKPALQDPKQLRLPFAEAEVEKLLENTPTSAASTTRCCNQRHGSGNWKNGRITQRWRSGTGDRASRATETG